MKEKNNFSLIVDGVFNITGRGTIITGHVQEGCIQKDDKLKLVSENQTIKTQCVYVEKFRKVVKKAEKGEHIGICVFNVSKADVQIGMLLISDE